MGAKAYIYRAMPRRNRGSQYSFSFKEEDTQVTRPEILMELKLYGNRITAWFLCKINYRMGAFRFLVSEKIRRDGDLNVGLLDQRRHSNGSFWIPGK